MGFPTLTLLYLRDSVVHLLDRPENEMNYFKKNIPVEDILFLGPYEDASVLINRTYVNAYTDNTYVMDLTLLKNLRKTEARTARFPLFAELDVLYYIEADMIYQTGTFQKTSTMDEIMRKKRVLRDLPADIDALTAVNEVLAFVIPTSIADL